MGRLCSVLQCDSGSKFSNNTYRKAGVRPPSIFKIAKEKLNFLSFPRDADLSNCYVCELHFESNCIIKSNNGVKTVLKIGATPTIDGCEVRRLGRSLTAGRGKSS